MTNTSERLDEFKKDFHKPNKKLKQIIEDNNKEKLIKIKTI